MLGSWKFWTVIGAILSLTALFAFGFTKNPKEVPSPLVGKPAPPFSLTELNTAEPLTLADLKGKPFLLNFWASWCVACRAEAPLLQAAHEHFEKRLGVMRVIGIAIQDTVKDARAFAKEHGKTYYLAMDNDAGDISLAYGLYGVPETFFVDAEGIIRSKRIGQLTEESLRSGIDGIIGEAPRTANPGTPGQIEEE